MTEEFLLTDINFMYPRLCKRRNGYHIDMNVPEWLRRKAWRKRIMVSLQTQDIDVALHRRELLVTAYSNFLTRMYKIPDLGPSDFGYAHWDFVKLIRHHFKLLNESHSQTDLS